MTRALAIAALLALAACGADGVGTPDCRVAVQIAPDDPTAPGTITLRTTVTSAEGLGVLEYQWHVFQQGVGEIEVVPRTPSYRDIDFVAPAAGVYRVNLTIPRCEDWTGDVNVRNPDANQRTLRLRFTPTPGTSTPGQERVLTIPGGASYQAGVLSLDNGVPASIVVRDPAGAIVPAYVRLTSRATPDVLAELVTGAAGTDTVQLLPGNADVLVVPLDGAHAPARVDDWSPLVGSLTVDGGAVATGLVLGPSGAPVAGARVSLASADRAAPSTIATTGSDGGFALRWTAPHSATLSVVPPPASGLPRLTAPIDALSLGRPLTVQYASTLVTRALGGTALRVDGALAAGGHATFAIDVAAAATIGDGVTSVSADGRHRDTVAIDDDGLLAPYRASAAAGRGYLRGTTGPGAVVLFDLATGAPSRLDGAGASPLVVDVLDDAGQPIAGAQLRATVTGDLAHLAAAEVTAITDDDGRATLALAPGATYQLDVSDPRRRHASIRVGVGAGGSLEPIALPDSIAIAGELRATGASTGLPSVGVTALCYACTGPERAHPLGDAVTGPGGTFSIVIPDPGIAP